MLTECQCLPAKQPIFGDKSSGMHTHQSLWHSGTNFFYDANGYGLINLFSANCRRYNRRLLPPGRAFS